MIDRLRDMLAGPLRRRDEAFIARMRRSRYEALMQSRESLRQQRRLRQRTNYFADDLYGGPPPPAVDGERERP